MLGKILDVIDTKSSSSDNLYTTVLFEDRISCNCPAGGRKCFCKHMVSIIHKNLELIKTINIDFYNDLIKALEMKNDVNKDLEQYIELLRKLIYVNKDIANDAFIHSENLKQ